MDLKTPNSHIESLILAAIVIISWKAPRMKQIIEVMKLKKSTSLIEFLMSSSNDFISHRIR